MRSSSTQSFSLQVCTESELKGMNLLEYVFSVTVELFFLHYVV